LTGGGVVTVGVVTLEGFPLIPIWTATSRSAWGRCFARLEGGIGSVRGLNVTDQEVYNWSTATQLYAKAYCASWDNTTYKDAKFDMIYTFANYAGNEIIFNVPSDATYYLFWDIKFDYWIQGTMVGTPGTNLECKSKPGFAAYKDDDDDINVNPNLGSIDEIAPEWSSNVAELMLQGDPDFMSGTKRLYWTREGKYLDDSEYVCFTLDAFVQAIAHTGDTQDNTTTRTRYYNFEVRIYIFTW
jgi:hypothetical protein